MRKVLAELIGTFALVFAGTGAIVVDDVSHGTVTHVGVSLTFGLIVLAMIYTLGDVSGAHLNPAVTLGFVTAGRMAGRDAASILRVNAPERWPQASRCVCSFPPKQLWAERLQLVQRDSRLHSK